MVFVNLARFHSSIQPTIHRLESDAEFLGELGLAELVLETVGNELVDQVPTHELGSTI